MSNKQNDTLLQVKNLHTVFDTFEGRVKAVEGVSFSINEKEILGVVGESGCGKSVMALSLLRLIPSPPGKIIAGEILFRNTDLLRIAEKEMRKIRGNEISMIFQEPMTSLNPVFTIGDQIAEAIRLHQHVSKKESLEKTVEMLRLVGIPNAEERVWEYPHEMSGGMKQRVMIAMALSCHPALLIADEPTTALDVTIQAQILELILDMRDKFSTAVILITHDLGVVAETAERVIVMYAGRIVEIAPVLELFHNPAHPYTRGLLNSIPRLHSSKERKKKLPAIPGTVPDLNDMVSGCKFHPRCAHAMVLCREKEPELLPISSNHFSRCWLNQ
ncbi:peptide ABC transporter ATP-binding protein [candidate division KSB1 bacterium 4484_87]|nr:MAG: peptide ABC transporter ATP-binding protein [candidate division KSB1 bacterium 4484_87]